jgi:uncharacterized protein
MKKLLSIIFLLLSVQIFAQNKSLPVPNPPRLVNDFANALTSYDAQQLERKLVELDNSTSNQIAIAIVGTLKDEAIEDVAVATFRNWGIGGKKNNNGILILVAIQDRKVRIEVGDGLEGAIPDVTAKDIIENDLKPAFRQGNYYSGLNKAVDDLGKAATGEYKVQKKKGNGGAKGGSILGFIIIIFVVLIIIMRGGGGRGGGRRNGGIDFFTPMLLGSMLGGGGRSSGGDWGGGGGGFGGFGGGSSSGGGASGSW